MKEYEKKQNREQWIFLTVMIALIASFTMGNYMGQYYANSVSKTPEISTQRLILAIKPKNGKTYTIETLPVSVVRQHGKAKLTRLIQQMKVGDSGYTYPWAYDPRTGYLDINYKWGDEISGTMEMYIQLTKVGLEVTPPTD